MTLEKITKDFHRKIVLAGKKGAGKSSIANMLVQGNMFSNNRSILNGSSTNDLKVDVVDGRGWSVCDITGLGYLGEPDSKSWIAAQMMLTQVCGEGKYGREGFDLICFVIEKEMAAKKDEFTNMLWANFQKLFGAASECFVVIVTHFDEENPPKQWLKKNKQELKSIYGDIHFIATDFMFDPENPKLYFDARDLSLVTLENDIRLLFQNKSPIDPRIDAPNMLYWSHSQPASAEAAAIAIGGDYNEDDEDDEDDGENTIQDDESFNTGHTGHTSYTGHNAQSTSVRNDDTYGYINMSGRNVESYGYNNMSSRNVESYGYNNMSSRNVTGYGHSIPESNSNISATGFLGHDTDCNYKCEQQ